MQRVGVLGLVILLIGMIMGASWLGLLMTEPFDVPEQISALASADYSAWESTPFQRVSPLLGTLIAQERLATAQADLARATTDGTASDGVTDSLPTPDAAVDEAANTDASQLPPAEEAAPQDAPAESSAEPTLSVLGTVTGEASASLTAENAEATRSPAVTVSASPAPQTATPEPAQSDTPETTPTQSTASPTPRTLTPTPTDNPASASTVQNTPTSTAQSTAAQPAATATPTATTTAPPTAAPTDTPTPTATPQPTDTPQPTATPSATLTPFPTPTPFPTLTPLPTSIPAPVAAFTAVQTSTVPPLTISITNFSIGQITSYAWNFGDGSTGSGQNPVHSYAAPGIYTITLTVTGPGGSNTTFQQIVIVAEEPPQAVFSANPRQGAPPLIVSFTNQTEGDITTTYLWSFGDGGQSTAYSPSYTYNTAGTYTVTLIVTHPAGTTQASTTITVRVPPPTVDFIADPVSGFSPLLVNFASLATGEITDYQWSFGDGASVSGVTSTSRVYTVAGDYLVTLTVTGPGGSVSASKVIQVVAPPPMIDANFNQTILPQGDLRTVSFTNLSTGDITGIFWDFGDGTTSTEASPVHTYPGPGSYLATLTVTGPAGTDTASQVVNIVN
ncbi:MAG: hypothetical protein OHK0046_20860 [Anaerolineae bacterium]